jgi:hypothetical protein
MLLMVKESMYWVVKERKVWSAMHVNGPNLFACLVYDTKPAHMLLMVEESMYWVVKEWKIWSAVHGQICEIGYLHLNFIDNYNINMISTNTADQLCNDFGPNHWMGNQKWCGEHFHWRDRSGRCECHTKCRNLCTTRRRCATDSKETIGGGGGVCQKSGHTLRLWLSWCTASLFSGQISAHLSSTISELDDPSIGIPVEKM